MYLLRIVPLLIVAVLLFHAAPATYAQPTGPGSVSDGMEESTARSEQTSGAQATQGFIKNVIVDPINAVVWTPFIIIGGVEGEAFGIIVINGPALLFGAGTPYKIGKVTGSKWDGIVNLWSSLFTWD